MAQTGGVRLQCQGTLAPVPVHQHARVSALGEKQRVIGKHCFRTCKRVAVAIRTPLLFFMSSVEGPLIV